MVAALIQLSDIHLRANDENNILNRKDKLVAAIQTSMSAIDKCVLIVSGDIAFSGKEEEYKIANELLDDIRICLLDKLKGNDYDEIVEIVVPGNHDCYLNTNPRSRELLLDSVLKDHEPSTKTQDISECLTVQDNFFAFATYRLDRTFATVGDRLAWDHILDVGGKTIRIRCFNSAWLTRLHEEKGHLLAPIWLADSPYQADLNIAVFHHPTSWFATDNARLFGKLIDTHFDIAFTGHEHDPETYKKEDLTGRTCVHFEASALQDDKYPNLSGFSIFLIDLDRRTYKIDEYSWNGNLYQRTTDTDWKRLERLPSTASDQITINEKWRSFLESPGAGFTHPRKSNLVLRDIFVYPDLSEWNVARGRGRLTLSNKTTAHNLAANIRNQRKSLIFGQEQSGKTALAKIVYQDLLEMNVVPVYVLGDQFKALDLQSIQKVIEKSFALQYDQRLLDMYRQLPIERRVIILDNFEKNVFNRTGWSNLVKSLEQQCGSLVVLASDAFQIKEMRDLNLSDHPLLDFKRYWVHEFGHARRYEIIKKWLIIGQEFSISEPDLTRNIKDAEHLMRIVLGRNLIPSFPIFVLSIMQTREAASTTDTATGAYGYHFETLIKDQLKGIKTNLSPNILNAYLAYLAFSMFKDKRKFVDYPDYTARTSHYEQAYAINVQGTLKLDALIDARILQKTQTDAYKFTYPYMYYYFVAKYFATNLNLTKHEVELRTAIDYIVHHLHVEEYANVLVFLAYLTSDEKIIRLVMERAKEQYASYKPCNYGKDLDFLADRVSIDIDKLPPIENPEEPECHVNYRQRTDDGELLQLDTDDDDQDDRITEHDLDEFLQLNVALKIMQILGQIVRNIPGTLPAELKIELIHDAYRLGLRVMQYVLSQTRDNLEDVLQYFAARIKSELRITDPAQLTQRTGAVLADLMLMAAFGVVQRISYAVGSSDLAETYKSLHEEGLETAYSVIGATIKMDHFPAFPKREIVDLYNNLEKTYPLTKIILQWLVRDYFNKYPEDRVLRQSVCNHLHIPINDVRYLTPSNKKYLK